MKIRRRDLQYLLAFAAIATIVASGVAYRILSPLPSEQFYAMSILGSNGLAEHYYPSDNPNIMVGENVSWTLGIYNHMGALEYVIVRVKLLNSTQQGPDEQLGSPSPVPPLFEFTRVLLDNETWSVPFTWRIMNLTRLGVNLLISRLYINELALSGRLASAVSGLNYRFVLELWFYDEAANDLVFSWRTQNVQHSVWTQIWFNATTTR